MTRTDTIVAAATPLGRGGIGIVRVSGPKVPELAAVILGDGARSHRSRERAAHLRGGGDRLSGRGTRLSGRPRARRAVSSRARPFRWRRAKRAPGPTPA